MGYMDSLQGILNKDFSKADEATRERHARDLIEVCSLASAALALQPIPTLELAIMPIQVGMMVGIGHIYGQSISRERGGEILAEIAGAVGLSVVARQTMLTISKFIFPVFSGLVAAPYIYGVTRGMGRAAIYYFQNLNQADPAQMKTIFNQAKQEAEATYDKRRVEEAAQAQQEEAQQDTVTRMEQLKTLRDKGLISDEEYESKRKEILAGL